MINIIKIATVDVFIAEKELFKTFKLLYLLSFLLLSSI
jgi:hypothetical protein